MHTQKWFEWVRLLTPRIRSSSPPRLKRKGIFRWVLFTSSLLSFEVERSFVKPLGEGAVHLQIFRCRRLVFGQFNRKGTSTAGQLTLVLKVGLGNIHCRRDGRDGDVIGRYGSSTVRLCFSLLWYGVILAFKVLIKHGHARKVTCQTQFRIAS